MLHVTVIANLSARRILMNQWAFLDDNAKASKKDNLFDSRVDALHHIEMFDSAINYKFFLKFMFLSFNYHSLERVFLYSLHFDCLQSQRFYFIYFCFTVQKTKSRNNFHLCNIEDIISFMQSIKINQFLFAIIHDFGHCVEISVGHKSEIREIWRVTMNCNDIMLLSVALFSAANVFLFVHICAFLWQ